MSKLYDVTDTKYERSFDRPNPYIAGRGYERKVPAEAVANRLGPSREYGQPFSKPITPLGPQPPSSGSKMKDYGPIGFQPGKRGAGGPQRFDNAGDRQHNATLDYG